MNTEARSRALREEADAVLRRIRLHERCALIGEITPTGSYFMDLMMYPDIDLYLPPTTTRRLLALGAELAAYPFVKKLNFQKGMPGELAEGLYLKPVIEHGEWGRPWKVDIWSLDPALIARKQAELQSLKDRMTPEQRRRILDYKFSILTDENRTPMFSGIFIYRAIIDRGLESDSDITAFLRENGIGV